MKPIDNHVLEHLGRFRRAGVPPTAREIAEEIGLSLSTVNESLRRMEAEGMVRKVGVAASGARTWTVVA